MKSDIQKRSLAVYSQYHSDIFNQLPGFIMGMDLKGNYLFANENFAKTLGLKCKEQIVRLAFKDVPAKVCEFAEIHIQQNLEIFNNNTKVKLLDIHPYANDQILNICFKSSFL